MQKRGVMKRFVLIIIFVALLGKSVAEAYSINKFYHNIEAVAESESSIEQIQIINYTPDGAKKNIIGTEKYNDCIEFLQSLKVKHCDNKDLYGTSKQIVIKYNDTELSVLFMGKYIIYDNIYYTIENYSGLDNILDL
ncbi:MAG: hypothetical protein K2J40_02455 [Ruminococcus sp.]|nr:hypothetical protein [Ruminococcus sp.]